MSRQKTHGDAARGARGWARLLAPGLALAAASVLRGEGLGVPAGLQERIGLESVRAGFESFRWDPEDRAFLYYLEQAKIVLQRLTIEADRVLVIVRPGKTEDGAAPPEKGKIPPFEVYAEGNLLLSHSSGIIRARAFFYDGEHHRGYLSDAWMNYRYERRRGGGTVESWLHVEADDVRFRGTIERFRDRLTRRERSRFRFESFLAKGALVSTCNFAGAHYGVSGDIEVRALPRRGMEPREADEYEGGLSGSWLKIQDNAVVPIPRLRWDTRLLTSIPLREVGYSKSHKFGHRVHTGWRLDYFPGIRQLARSLDSELGFRIEPWVNVDYLSKRGVGYGLDADWGTKVHRWDRKRLAWRDYYGELWSSFIHDRGEDRNHVPPETDDRYRVRGFHRQELPGIGTLDIEVSKESDRNYLNEYYEREAKTEKVPETILYLRRTFGDNVLATFLTKARLDDFRTDVERIPEGKAFLIEQPLPGGFAVDSTVQAANLRYRRDEALEGERSFRSGRFDAVGEFSRPFGIDPFVRFRPLAEVRYTLYEKGRFRGHDIDRVGVGAGGAVSTQLSRVYPWESAMLNASAFKHVIRPQIAYMNRFENTVPPDDLFPFDEIDAIDRSEFFEFSLGNYVLTRDRVPETPDEPGDGRPFPLSRRATIAHPRPRMGPNVHRLLEATVLARYYPRPHRDNRGDRFSNIAAELLLNPTRYAALRTDVEYNPNHHGGFEVANVGLDLSRGTWWSAGVGSRWIKDLSSFFTGSVGLAPSSRYRFDAYYQYDLRRGRVVEQVYAVTRSFHRWALEIAVEIDEGEDRLPSFHVNFLPQEAISLFRRERM